MNRLSTLRILSQLSFLLTLLFALASCGARQEGVTLRSENLLSENFNSRVSIIVIHHTSANFQESVALLTKPSSNPVSSHYLIPEPNDASYTENKLRLYKLVPETERAWHAGRSYWAGKKGLNDHSIGIEIVNQVYCHKYEAPNPMLSQAKASHINETLSLVSKKAASHTEIPSVAALPVKDAASLPIKNKATLTSQPQDLCFYPDFAEDQMTIVLNLLKDIYTRHPDIKPTNIVGHSDIAADRKIDPGPRFPWQRLYQLGFGAWFDNETVTKYWKKFIENPLPILNIQQALKTYGYDIEPTGILDDQTSYVLRAFQLHFRPSEITRTPTVETTAILFALIEKYRPKELESLLTIAVTESE